MENALFLERQRHSCVLFFIAHYTIYHHIQTRSIFLGRLHLCVSPSANTFCTFDLFLQCCGCGVSAALLVLTL